MLLLQNFLCEENMNICRYTNFVILLAQFWAITFFHNKKYAVDNTCVNLYNKL